MTRAPGHSTAEAYLSPEVLKRPKLTVLLKTTTEKIDKVSASTSPGTTSDDEGDKEEKEKDLTANVQLMATAEHYGITDVEWDPTGRYVASVASVFRHQVSIFDPA